MNQLLNATILVVDDNPSNLQMMAKMLSYAGYTVKTAHTGEAALQTATEEMPDLMLLDLVMPGMDGIEVCRKIKSEPATREIPVIFCTGNDQLNDMEKCFDAGGDDYTTKPIQTHLVLNRIATHLELAALRKRYRDEQK